MEQRKYAQTVSSNTLEWSLFYDDLCLNNFTKNYCGVIKYLTLGNIERWLDNMFI